jgi:uncharacterized protein (TIGR02246 family)
VHRGPMPKTTPSEPTVLSDVADHAPDIAEIRRVVADIETGFNTNDAELAVAHFAADATATTATGVRVTGRDALLDAHRTGLAGALADQFARYEVVEVTFPRPDVALAHKRAWATDEHGTDLDVGHAMVALYVLVREGGRWWIAARANTLVV